MANQFFRGDKQAVTDTWTYLISSNTNTHVHAINRNGKTLSVTADGVLTVNQLASALQVLLAASAEPEFFEYTWTVDTATVTGTRKTTGAPAEFTASGSGTHTLTNTINGAGPNSLTGNFATDAGVVGDPATGNDLYFTQSDVDALYDLDGLSTFGSVTVDLSYEANIGLPRINESGATPYVEDRECYLTIPDCPLIFLGAGSGQGGSRWQFDLGEGAGATIHVYGSGTSDDGNYHPIRFKTGTPASGTHTLNVYGGAVDLAPFPENSANIATIKVSGNGVVRASRRVVLGSVEVTGQGSFAGALFDDALATLTMRDNAIVTLTGDSTGVVATCKVLSGYLDYRSAGTITTLTLGTGAVLDASKNVEGFTITNCTRAAGSTINDPNGKITFSSPITYQNCGVEDCPNDRFGKGITIARAVS